MDLKPLEEINNIFEWERQISEAEYHRFQLTEELALVNRRIEALKNMRFVDNGLDINFDIVIRDPKERKDETE